MQTKLATLRQRLGHLRRSRAAVRWGSAVCAPIAVALWLLVAAFLCDWSFDLPLSIRGLVLVGWIAGGIWAVRTLAWPLVCIRESEQDVALLVEQQHRIDTDLVAALQFEQPQAAKWGSSRLEQAVVDYVAEFSPSLDVYQGFSYQTLPKRAGILVVTLLLIAVMALVFPEHASAFWNRFLLGGDHYPTKTRIVSIEINGQSVPVHAPRKSLFSKSEVPHVRISYGQQILVQAQCEGVIPAQGFANLAGVNSDAVNRVSMAATSVDSTRFTTEISNVADSFRVRIEMGDALSDAAEVVIVPLPLVDISWNVTPPKYAATAAKPVETDGGSRQLAVLEGSSAGLTLVCSNKRLKSASMTLNGSTDSIALVAGKSQDSTGQWHLPKGTPFDFIRAGLKYEIQVEDEDGLSMESTIKGEFRLRTDRLPRIVASAVTRQVLPTATPKLDYAAGDDFGVARIVAIVQISREDGTSSRHEVVSKVIKTEDQPVSIIRDQIPVPLSPYELKKGDEVKVTLEVTDWRGDIPGQKGIGESVTFNVTDLNGILAQTGDEDKKTAKQLDEILRRELGISGEKK
jgi:hypothetical protein